MKKSIKLNVLKVASFQTSTQAQQLKGGWELEPMPDEPTGLGPSCEWTRCDTHTA